MQEGNKEVDRRVLNDTGQGPSSQFLTSVQIDQASPEEVYGTSNDGKRRNFAQSSSLKQVIKEGANVEDQVLSMESFEY